MTIIVGPNNAGKSATIRGVHNYLSRAPHTAPPTGAADIVSNVTVDGVSYDYIMGRLQEQSEVRPPGTYSGSHIPFEHLHFSNSTNISTDEIRMIATQCNALGSVYSFLVSNIEPRSFWPEISPSQIPDMLESGPANPMQRIWSDRRLEKRISTYASRAFGIELTLNRHSGINTTLHIGRPEAPEPAIGEVSPYLEELKRMPRLDQQGHGMQAYLGLVVALITHRYDIILLDEPEAFLHPPQARLLGRLMVELSREGTQIIAATHSGDFVQGVLAATTDKSEVSIVRLTRPSLESNAVAQIDPPAMKQLYDDPLLRYSNILDGIFYEGVLLCEAEADCKYYSAVVDHKNKVDNAAKVPDLLYTHCGGKDRLYKAYSALKLAKVPTAIIADIDLLADIGKFNAVYSAMGGDPKQLTVMINKLTVCVRNKAKTPQRDQVRKVVTDVLDAASAQELTKDEIKTIREATSQVTGWEELKKKGRNAVDRGEPLVAFNEILAACAERGLFLLPVGELESFHPTIGGNKQAWLREVFETRAYENSPDASAFLDRVIAFIHSHQQPLDRSEAAGATSI